MEGGEIAGRRAMPHHIHWLLAELAHLFVDVEVRGLDPWPGRVPDREGGREGVQWR